MERRAAGEPEAVIFAVACDGTLDDVPDVPPTASFVEYQLNALRRPFDASDSHVSRSLSVAVTDAPSVDSVEITPRSLDLSVGDEESLAATVNAVGGASTDVTWSSSDPDAVAVDPTGVVSALGPGTSIVTATSVFDLTKTDSIPVTGVESGTLRWAINLGTDSEAVGAVATDPEGNVIVAVNTQGGLVGPSGGGTDVALLKFSPQNEPIWVVQFGSAADDRALGVATDLAGNVVVAGRTFGDLAEPNAGASDAFVAVFGPDGKARWRVQFGTAEMNYATAVSTDALGNVLVAGVTADSLTGEPLEWWAAAHGFLVKFDSGGRELWTRQFFSTSQGEHVHAVASGPGGDVAVAVTGHRDHGYVQYFDTAGEPTRVLTFGTYTSAIDVAFDASGATFVVGTTMSDNPWVFSSTAYLAKFDSTGERLWDRSIGPVEGSFPYSVATDARGNALVAGLTQGDLGGSDPDAPGFLVKYDADGDRTWVHQFHPVAEQLAVDSVGNSYVVGNDGGAVRVAKLSP